MDDNKRRPAIAKVEPASPSPTCISNLLISASDKIKSSAMHSINCCTRLLLDASYGMVLGSIGCGTTFGFENVCICQVARLTGVINALSKSLFNASSETEKPLMLIDDISAAGPTTYSTLSAKCVLRKLL